MILRSGQPSFPGTGGWVSRFLRGPHAPWLTHGCLMGMTLAYFGLQLLVPFWIALVPAVILSHRIGALLHEYMHGIPFRRYSRNHAVVTFFDGIMLMFGTLEMFRVSHLRHHRWLNTDHDQASDKSAKVGRNRLLSGEWLELSFSRNGFVRRIPRRVTTTGQNGWFAMCNVPSAGMVALLASRGADSTDVIEVKVPAEGFLRHELYLGTARTGVTESITQRADTLAPTSRRLHTGDGTLRGTVVTAADWKPLAGAQVSITNGPQTRANERGEWALVDAPVGTRMLEVRALGYYPDRRRVDVVAGAAPVRVALSTLKAVLDTVRVTARRLNRDPNGFEQRRRSAYGHFLTAEDIARRQPIVTSDLFRNVPGIRLEYDAGGLDKRILMRGAFGMCAPAIYIDGMSMTSRTADNDAITVTADDIDTWMRPHEVTGIEIYTGDAVPPQYQQGMSGCGSILIWTNWGR